jgi:diguanylate cyclase (GGDEF)-like protein
MNGLRTFVRTIISLIALWLLLMFAIRIFAPGNADTAAVFKTIAMLQPLLDAGTYFLIWPIQLVMDWLSSYLPADARVWFPVSQAAPFFQTINTWILALPSLSTSDVGRQMANVNFKYVFPGVLDWRLLLGLCFWGVIENMLLKLIIGVEAKQYRSHIRQRDADILASFRVSEDDPKTESPEKNLLFRQVVNELKTEVSKLSKNSSLDPLTRLFNRGYFNTYLDAELSKAKWQKSSLALLMIDIDNFKKVNDTYGHLVGDEVLQKVAAVIPKVQPLQGHLAAFRYGGEELAIILTDTTSQMAQQVGERVRADISQIHIDTDPSHSVSASIGCYTINFAFVNNADDITSETLIQKADSLLYTGKHSGKNRVVSEVLG